MGYSTRMTKSFTIDRAIDKYISSTKGAHSASERVNEMLKRAIKQERYDKLEEEAQVFYAKVGDSEREEVRAFQNASIQAMARD